MNKAPISKLVKIKTLRLNVRLLISYTTSNYDPIESDKNIRKRPTA